MPTRITKTSNLFYDALLSIRHSDESITKCEEEEFSKIGVLPQQFHILRAIKYIPGVVTPSIVANWVDRNPNSITLIINRMEKDGLVKRKRDLTDRRALRLIITPKGEELYKRTLKTALRELPKTILSTLSESELSTLIILLNKVREQTFKLRKIEDKVINIITSDVAGSDDIKIEVQS
jgi:DNA-binding MarR family transcriptional regulator